MFSTWDWCLAAAVTLLCVWAGDRWLSAPFAAQTGKPLRHGTLLACCLIAAGTALRLLAMLRMGESALLPEEIETAVQARSLWLSGKSLEGHPWPAMLPGLSAEGNGSLLTWLAMPLLALTGLAGFSQRLPMLLVQALGLYALWRTLRDALSPRAALWALGIAAVSPWALLQSGWAQSWALLPHLLMLAIWLFTRPCRRTACLLGGAILLALAMYTGDTAWFVAPLFVTAALAVLWARKAVTWRQTLAALGVWALVAAPALGAWTAQTFHLPGHTVLGMYVEATERYPHNSDWVTQDVKWDDDWHGNQDWWPRERELRGRDPHIARLYEDVLSNLYRGVLTVAMQNVEDPASAVAVLDPEQGFLYLCSLPLMLLGAVRLLSRLLARRKRSPAAGTLWALWGCLAGAALCFLLLHMRLAPAHYGVLFYPAVLLVAAGASYIARRLRFAGLPLAAVYAVALGLLLARTPDLGPTYPGLSDALAYAAAMDTPKTVVTTRLYPNDNPGRAAALQAIRAYGLDPAYVRGETQTPGQLPYAERFSYIYFPSYTQGFASDAAYVLYGSEAEQVDPAGFREIITFGEYAVLLPLADPTAAEDAP
ncbi:MAG: glycosyltransferase family 39 protein [Oscillospiraceae bacterium]|jgi:4-amino-4-deoxy-L-arabinose transferase-like glycosyltransferase|nr:glycosyltransferase family 39 protein [Oscillospiraceae bacterium]